MFSAINYLRGDFEKCIEDQHCPFYYRLNSVMYSCDHLFIARSLEKLLSTDTLVEPWYSRVKIYKGAVHLLRKQMTLAKDCIETVDTKSVIEQYDTPAKFFRSLYEHLSELLKFEATGANKVALVGDSHVFSISYSVSEEFPPVYIPSIQMKFVGQGRSSYLESALLNALTVCQKHDQIVISIGEIDQRFLYVDAADLDAFERSLDNYLNFLVDNTFHWQKIKLVALPAFNERLFEMATIKSEPEKDVRDRLNTSMDLFNTKAIKKGFDLVERDNSDEKLLDAAHYHPSAYLL